MRGAAVATQSYTYRVDAIDESAFDEYIQHNYNIWTEFLTENGYGEDIQPVLVSGFDLVRDYDMVAYREDPSEIISTSAIPRNVPADRTPTWVAEMDSEHWVINTQLKLPERPDPLPLETVQEPSLLQLTSVENIPKGFNRYTFIRYSTMRLNRPRSLWTKIANTITDIIEAYVDSRLVRFLSCFFFSSAI